MTLNKMDRYPSVPSRYPFILANCAVGILVTILSQILRHSGREEHAFLLSLAGLILVLRWIVPCPQLHLTVHKPCL